MALISPAQIQRQDVILPRAREQNASPMSSRAARPTPWRRASLAACGGLGVSGNWANVLNAWPTTKVMKGAMPPAMRDEKMAGTIRHRKCFREMRENNSRMDVRVGCAG